MSTYKYSDLTTLIAKGIPKSFIDDNAATLCNLATNKIWMRYDWRESLASLPPVYLLPNIQDIGSPLNAVPSDLQGLREVKIRLVNGAEIRDTPLQVLRNCEPTEFEGHPTAISYIKELQCLRLHPRPTSEFSAPNYFLSGIYKKLPTKITSSTLNTLLPFDDIYFQVWLETMRWAAFSVLGDPKAGTNQSGNGQRFTTGQLATCEAMIDQMAEDQGINSGEVAVAPSEPIWGGGC